MSLPATDPEIIVDPSSFIVDLVGGCNATRNINVTWTGSNAVLCNISTNVTSDCPGNNGEGINVTYSENLTFTLEPGINHVEMTIEAAVNIMPGVYTIITDFSCSTEKPPAPSPLSPSYLYHPFVNTPPVADTSAGEPYQGFAGGGIIFDGSNSSDVDGTITEWYWDFGDGTNGTGEITSHNYSTPGIYNVTLTVTDNNGDTDIYETAAIISQANRPPTLPMVNGTRNGSKNIEYDYTAMSMDLDNDTLRYFFNWDDGTNAASGSLASGISYNVSHKWTTAGIYLVTVYAMDTNNATSGTTELLVLIDVHYCSDIGYLIDSDSNNVYDLFYCNETGKQTVVEQKEGNYLIDSDGDTIWDYEYDPETNILTVYTPLKEKGENMTIWYALLGLILMIAISVIIFVYFLPWVKKKKKE